MDYLQSLQEAVHYIESNLENELTYADVAAHVYLSPYHFMRIWKSATGLTLTEYVRNRRLYLAICALTAKPSLQVIEVAYAYHYASPSSFAKAFKAWNGCSCTKARKDPHKIRVFLPLTISPNVQGGPQMDYTIESKKAFRIIGVARRFSFDEGYAKIPAFWSETVKKICQPSYPHFDLVKGCRIGEFGVCVNDGGNDFLYLIAGTYQGEEVPSDFCVKEIPASLWAIFKCKGPLPGSLQSVNTAIWKDWLPQHPEFELSANIDIEFYSDGDMQASDYTAEIWLPIKKK
jgi:predicted transcriptional regulator YdeE/AraC-like DNA-binding protein